MEASTQGAVKSGRVGRKRVKALPESGTVQITLRIPVEIVRQIDAEIARIARENFGATVERTEIIRRLIVESLTRRAKRGK